MESGSIASWNLKEGDLFAAGDVFCSVETDKATVDFEAQDDGVLAKILVQAGGGDIKVGEPIMVTVDSADDVAAFQTFSLGTTKTATPPAASSAPLPAAPISSPTAVTPPPSTPAAVSAIPSARGDRIVASPKAYKVAKELGYDLAAIPGTGPGGRILAADVHEFVPSAAVAAETAPPTEAPGAVAVATATPTFGDGFTDYPLSDSSKEVAARLAQSKRNVPHYYLTVDINCDELLKLRDSLGMPEIGVYELLIKSAALSMQAVPTVNAAWMGDFVRVYDAVDMNVVVGNGDELYTPVLSDVGRLGLKAISKELATAVSALDPNSDAFAPITNGVGTFTFLNLGMYGIKACAPIIREPQACALAVGALETRIVPSNDPDTIYQESEVLTATLSCDHRVVDGAVGAQWLAAFKGHIENPVTLLL
ncbi:pyruvate dehydrogenase E2 component [Fistulifera solaris]|uniref:Dihydrolipoamide acetyltransferase component of pyruvate dehydrogenase complex n=1 Tax=Fistulifera solaris TaxID=1519565 RepID=A0A1Z5JYK0_FISSO|nr:pyruvate dehydrogenase E2 component [Fistulifera solaris]|eukprot:GAX19100.1 pyruvate dehydrogenase E2 component [Fistulifera solaris]